MALLIMIKSLTDVYDSPSVAYYCGNAYPWFYSSPNSLEELVTQDGPFDCLVKPATCSLPHYYQSSASFDVPKINQTITAYSQYGYVSSAASSGSADAPFYAFTIGDPSFIYYLRTKNFKMDNPSMTLCDLFSRVTYQPSPAIIAIAPVNDDNQELTALAQLLRVFLIDWCVEEGYYSYATTLVDFPSQSSVESYMTSKHYDDRDYEQGKIAFSIILNSADVQHAQWDYAVRANYTSFWDQGDKTVACLYDSWSCSFTYTVPSTKFSTDDLAKPQSAEYLYGYTYSGFATLQQAVDQFIFAVQSRIAEQTAQLAIEQAVEQGRFVASEEQFTDETSQRQSPDTDQKLSSTRRLDERDSLSAKDQIHSSENEQLGSIQAESTALPASSWLHRLYATDRVVKIMASVGLMPTAAYKTDNFQYIISSTLGIFYMLSFLYPVSRIIRALVLEKETRIKEGMKMMGLTDSAYNLSWLITTFIQMTFVSILITLVTGSSVFEYSNKVYVFIYFEAFSLAVINMCFLLSTFFSRSKSASLLGPMIFFASFFPYYAVNDDQFDSSAKAATCVLAPACFALGAEVFADYEGGLVGVQASNVNLETSNFTYNLCVGMLFFDAVLYGVLAWYMDNVLPSEFGTPLPLYFPFLPSYWLGGTHSGLVDGGAGSDQNWWENIAVSVGLRQPRYGDIGREENAEGGTENALHANLLDEDDAHSAAQAPRTVLLEQQQQQEGEFIEAVSADLLQQSQARTCLSIRGLRKVFKNAAGGSDRVAVDKLNMELYQGQVTVLLGHNGAGKTTTISMLVGLTTPTAGDALFPGNLSIVRDMHSIRRNLGVCPQHDILFPELTVTQHLQIYASFKGVPSSQVASAAQSMLAEVGLTEKAHSRSSTLSGGQKRKLSLGIALIGDSKVVILDEPTSGMDPYSRRSTWNIIQRNKKGRIILLTTHFMDEADLLGDRVAIMAHGKLQCLGSPLFLKNKFGVGYTLTIVKAQQHPQHQAALVSPQHAPAQRILHNTSAEFADPPEEWNSPQSFVEASRRLLALVQGFIPDAEPLSDVGAEQSFRLPFEASGVFVELFSAFDAHKAELGISEYGISVTTLEEVFIRVGEMEQSINDLAEGNTTGSGPKSVDSMEKEELGAALGVPFQLEPKQNSHNYHGHGAGHLPSFPEEVQLEGETSPHSPRPVAGSAANSALTATNLDKNSATLSNASAGKAAVSPPIHGILVDHGHHGRQRSLSSGSNSRRSVSHDHAHLPGGAHKRVSFRDSASESGERSSILFDAQAAVMAGPPPTKEDSEFHIDSIDAHTRPSGGLHHKHLEDDTHFPNHHLHHHYTDDPSDKEIKLAQASGTPHNGSLFGVHFSALLTKRAIYAKRDRRMIFCQLVLPVLLVILGVTILLIKPNLNQPNLTLSGGKYNPDLSAEFRNFVPFSVDGSTDADSFPMQMMARFNGNAEEGVYGTAVPVTDLGGGDSFGGCAQGATVLNEVSEYILKSVDSEEVKNEHGSSRYGAVTIAANTNASNLNYNILLNGSAVHGVGTYVNLVHQAYLQVVSGIPDAKITVHNYPLPETYKQKNNAATADAFVVALFAMIAFCFVPASFAVFVVKEREVKAKHQQVISGVSIYAYWLSTYLWDIVSYLPTAGLVILIMYIYGVKAYTTSQAGTAFALLFVLYGPATAAFTYLISFIFASHSTAQIVVMFLNFITGLCLVVVSFVLTTIPSTTHQAYDLRYVFRIFPSFCLGDGIIQLALCSDGTSCPTISGNGYNFDGSQGPLAWDIAGGDLVCLFVHGLLYFILAVVIEYGLTFPSLLSWLYAVEDDEADLRYLDPASEDVQQTLLDPASAVEAEDEDVAAERVRVLSGAADKEVVRIQQLRKIYPANSRAGGIDLFACFRKAWRKLLACFVKEEDRVTNKKDKKGPATFKVAVQSLCFGIPKGQCFGFLGINGAGKTTTLSILSGEFPPTSGEAFIDGFSIRDDQTNIRRRIGYCPQFDALLELLTVREHLELYGRIKGFRGAGLEAIVRGKLVQLDLKDFEHKTAGSLSGGNKRKLSVAVATVGEPSIVFLDEPSTGMDPVARRFMWKVIARMTAEDAACSVILTTHSMEEAEALCSRIGVMVNGRLRCLGPAQHLKARFGNGFEVNVKLALPDAGVILAAGAAAGTQRSEGNALQEALRQVLQTNTRNTSELDAEASVTHREATISRTQVTDVCEKLGKMNRAAQVSPFQSGAMLHEALLVAETTSSEGEANGAPLQTFLGWWLAEDAAEDLHHFMLRDFGARAQLLERSTAHNFRYRVQLTSSADDVAGSDGATPPPDAPPSSNGSHAAQSALSDIFAKFEAHKAALRIVEYSVGQTTLEQIFNQFASQQDNPEVLGQAAAGTGGGVTANPLVA